MGVELVHSTVCLFLSILKSTLNLCAVNSYARVVLHARMISLGLADDTSFTTRWFRFENGEKEGQKLPCVILDRLFVRENILFTVSVTHWKRFMITFFWKELKRLTVLKRNLRSNFKDIFAVSIIFGLTEIKIFMITVFCWYYLIIWKI